MGWVTRRAGLVLAIGLLLGLGWTAVVTTSTPNWFDPSDACAELHTSWIPPRASCDYGNGDVRQYISTTRSVVLSITGLIILAVIATSLILVVRRLSGDPGPTRTADGVDLRRRKFTQLAFGALDVLVVGAVLTFFNAAAVIFGGIPGGILFIITSIAGLSALGVTLDRQTGPLPSTALDSRRRGTTAGATVFAVIFAATALTGQLPFFRLWSAPLAAVTYVVIAAWQWSRLPRHQSVN